MNKYLILSGFFLCFMALTFQSCDDTEEVLPYQGAVKQVTAPIENVLTFLDFIDINAAQAGFNLDASGGTATSMDVYVQHKNAGGAYGDRVLLKSVSDFPSDQMFSASELASPLGISVDSLRLADSFLLSFEVLGSDGKTYQSDDFVTIDLSCPSDIGGTYSAISSGQSTDGCCPDPATDVTAEDITITAQGGGVYAISDFSGGLWEHWYAVYGASGINEGEIKDVCNSISFQNTSELFGSPISGSGVWDAETQTITIDWTADSWGDVGSTVFTRTGD